MSSEHRRAPRRPVPGAIQVTNTMTGQIIGRIGNLSSEGMMLVLAESVQEDALFQVAFHLNTSGGRSEIEVGIHSLWCEAASSPQTWWAGCRIIDISDEDGATLSGWLRSQR